MRNSYRRLGREILTGLIQEVLGQPDDGNEGRDPCEVLNSKFLKWLGSGTGSFLSGLRETQVDDAVS